MDRNKYENRCRNLTPNDMKTITFNSPEMTAILLGILAGLIFIKWLFRIKFKK